MLKLLSLLPIAIIGLGIFWMNAYEEMHDARGAWLATGGVAFLVVAILLPLIVYLT